MARSPHLSRSAGRNWHRDRQATSPMTGILRGDTCRSKDAGCRGFVGPFPLPLWMSRIRLWSAVANADDATARSPALPTQFLRSCRPSRWAGGGRGAAEDMRDARAAGASTAEFPPRRETFCDGPPHSLGWALGVDQGSGRGEPSCAARLEEASYGVSVGTLGTSAGAPS